MGQEVSCLTRGKSFLVSFCEARKAAEAENMRAIVSDQRQVQASIITSLIDGHIFDVTRITWAGAEMGA
jgi:hypothetical protein